MRTPHASRPHTQAARMCQLLGSHKWMCAHDNKFWRPHRSMHAHTRVRTQESKDIIHDGAVFGEEAMLLHVRQRH